MIVFPLVHFIKRCFFKFSTKNFNLSQMAFRVSKRQRAWELKRLSPKIFAFGLSPFKRLVFICFNEGFLKMMKNVFDFMLKALLVLEIYKLLSWLLDYAKNGLIRNLTLISNFMTPRTGQQTSAIYIYIHIQPNISRRKGNQAMRLGQVIEYSIKILFLGNHAQNTVKKLISVPFKIN